MFEDFNWEDAPILAIDTETSGLGSADRIVEIALILMEGDKTLESFHSLVDPGCAMDPGATAVNNITDGMLVGKPKFAEIMPEVLDFLQRDAPWVAHNMVFDLRMLAKEIPYSDWPRGIPTLCTLEVSRKFLKHTGLPNFKLHSVLHHFDLPSDQEHRAIDDARQCGWVARRMTRGKRVGDFFSRYSEEWFPEIVSGRNR